MTVRAMRKMQVPAYVPAVWGVQAVEKRAVRISVWKVMIMPMEELLELELDEPSMPLMSFMISYFLLVVGASFGGIATF